MSDDFRKRIFSRRAQRKGGDMRRSSFWQALVAGLAGLFTVKLPEANLPGGEPGIDPFQYLGWRGHRTWRGRGAQGARPAAPFQRALCLPKQGSKSTANKRRAAQERAHAAIVIARANAHTRMGLRGDRSRRLS